MYFILFCLFISSIFSFLLGAPLVTINMANELPFRASQKLVLQGSVVSSYENNGDIQYLWSELSGQLSLTYEKKKKKEEKKTRAKKETKKRLIILQ